MTLIELQEQAIAMLPDIAYHKSAARSDARDALYAIRYEIDGYLDSLDELDDLEAKGIPLRSP